MPNNATRRLSKMFHLIAAGMVRAKDRLSDLDGAIGDADHGITMTLGFTAVEGELARHDLENCPPSNVLSIAATAFLDAVGASTGPLYATAFRRAAQAVKGDDKLGLAGQASIIEAMTQGIKERGKGQRGDKTMLDVWIPATEAAAEAREQAASIHAMWESIIEAAEKGEAATRSMVATRGRAARLGERSLGHTDPGAASAVIMLRAMREAFTMPVTN